MDAGPALRSLPSPHAICPPRWLLQRSYVVYPPSDVTDEKIQDVGAAALLGRRHCLGCSW